VRYFLDCEFDGAFGELISMALVSENFEGDEHEALYQVSQVVPMVQWVKDNVVPVLGFHQKCTKVEMQRYLRQYLASDQEPHFICDHPADIMYLASLLILDTDPANTCLPQQRYTFEVRYTPEMKATGIKSEIPHNALADAVALRKSYLQAHPV
jgi:hypothetical protein